MKKIVIAMAIVAGSFLASAPAALAQEVNAAAGDPVTAYAPVANAGLISGDGVLSGNVIQFPVTVVVPIQICNNAVIVAPITVAVGSLNAGFCTS